MSTDLLSKIRKINEILQESSTAEFSFNDICHVLSDLGDANV